MGEPPVQDRKMRASPQPSGLLCGALSQLCPLNAGSQPCQGREDRQGTALSKRALSSPIRVPAQQRAGLGPNPGRPQYGPPTPPLKSGAPPCRHWGMGVGESCSISASDDTSDLGPDYPGPRKPLPSTHHPIPPGYSLS